MGRFMSPDPLGGHLELPQSLNKYAYVMNNPLTLTDSTGLDFSLGCAKDNGTTCQGGSTYYKNADGDYKQTLISSDAKGNLSDQSGNSYTANVSGSGVTFSGNGGSNVAGTFVNGTNATTINGSGALSGFTFNFTNSDVAAHLSAQGTFTYSGNASQAITALQNAGFQHYTPDEMDFLHPSTTDYTAYDMRGVGGPGGVGAGHMVVQQPMNTDFVGWALQRTPLVTVPTRGTADLGTTNPYSGGAQGFLNHVGEALRHIF